MELNPPTQLSVKAFAELKTISIQEYGDSMSDHDIEEMGMRLLRLFDLLSNDVPKASPAKITVTDQ